jgi:hypothetical protein
MALIGESMWRIHLTGRPVARERYSKRGHSFVCSQDELVIVCVDLPDLLDSSTWFFCFETERCFGTAVKGGVLHRYPK